MGFPVHDHAVFHCSTFPQSRLFATFRAPALVFILDDGFFLTVTDIESVEAMFEVAETMIKEALAGWFRAADRNRQCQRNAEAGGW